MSLSPFTNIQPNSVLNQSRAAGQASMFQDALQQQSFSPNFQNNLTYAQNNQNAMEASQH